jgi:mannose/cellobiose epimerase-like protein (N-acyl-D-glucosamine 2-epimerase family)
MKAEGDADTQLAEQSGRLRRWLLDEALPLWWTTGVDHTMGGFHEAIGMDGRPVVANRRARVQARQIFSYATGGAMGWAGPWLPAVEQGLSFFLSRYRRLDGLFVSAVTADGTPVEAPISLYEQAFALLALATASRTPAGRPELAQMALQIFDQLSTHRRCPTGGFVELVGDQPYWANPQMHLLEAALAWEAIDASGPWGALADELAELCLARFLHPDTGALREYYDADWAPVAGLAGRIVEPGHQFEWAWLLERWGLARGRDDARAAARRLYTSGSGQGIDRRRGVAIFALLDDGSVHDPRARLWSQTEWLKAAVFLARSEPAGEQRQLYIADAAIAADTLLRFLDTPIRGLWRDQLNADGTWVEEPAPASSLYHIVGAIKELDVAGA